MNNDTITNVMQNCFFNHLTVWALLFLILLLFIFVRLIKHIFPPSEGANDYLESLEKYHNKITTIILIGLLLGNIYLLCYAHIIFCIILLVPLYFIVIGLKDHLLHTTKIFQVRKWRFQDIKNVVITIAYIGLIIGVVYVLSYIDRSEKNIMEAERQKVEQQKIAERENFLKLPQGQDEDALKKSLNSQEAVVSQTGKKYFRGLLCTEDCSGHKAGYDWATDLGITNDDACENKSLSFKEGCLTGVKEVLEELREYFLEQYPEDCYSVCDAEQE